MIYYVLFFFMFQQPLRVLDYNGIKHILNSMSDLLWTVLSGVQTVKT